jgi:DHA2 family multidrug resistance protein
MVAFLVHEATTSRPLFNLRVAFAAPLPSLITLIAFLRLTILATSFLIPLYLGSVRGYRDLEVGSALLWIAAPQLLFCPLAGLMLRRSDPRLVGSIGFVLISVACLMVAYDLTPIWGSDQFLPSALMQALGQSLALSGVIFFAVLHVKPQDALTFGAVLQTARLMGGEIGSAFVSTLSRVREQIASNLIGLHVQAGDATVLERIRAYGAATTRNLDPVGALHRGEVVLGNTVRAAATTQAVMDCFVAIAFLTAVGLLILITRRAAPQGPASAQGLFATSRPEAP